MQPTVTIDGAHGEGGGQILRTSLSLSVLTGRQLEIVHVRAGRTKPGLRPQHLAAVQAAAQISAADLEGAEVGSTRLSFVPRSPAVPGRYHFAIGTAGAASLVMQTVLLPLALASSASHVTVTGGTHVPFAPTTDYLSDVFGALLAPHGRFVQFHQTTAGFAPKGGGRLHAEIGPSARLQAVDLTERGLLRSLSVHMVTAHLPTGVAERGQGAVRQALAKFPDDAVTIRHDEVSLIGPGAAVVLIARCENGLAGFSALGARGKPIEAVANEACGEFQAWWNSGAACDQHGADQLVLPLSLVPGESRWTTPYVTDHLRTVLWTVQQFLPIEASIDERANGAALVTLRGVSLS